MGENNNLILENRSPLKILFARIRKGRSYTVLRQSRLATVLYSLLLLLIVFIFFLAIMFSWFDPNADKEYKSLGSRSLITGLSFLVLLIGIYVIKSIFSWKKLVIRVSDGDIIFQQRGNSDRTFRYDEVQQIELISLASRRSGVTVLSVEVTTHSGHGDVFTTNWFYAHPVASISGFVRHGYPVSHHYLARPKNVITIPACKDPKNRASNAGWRYFWPQIRLGIVLFCVMNIAVFVGYGVVNSRQTDRNEAAQRATFDQQRRETELKKIDYVLYEPSDEHDFSPSNDGLYGIYPESYTRSLEDEHEQSDNDRIGVNRKYDFNIQSRFHGSYELWQIKNRLGALETPLRCTRNTISLDDLLAPLCKVRSTPKGEQVYFWDDLRDSPDSKVIFKPVYVYVIKPTTIILLEETYEPMLN